VGLDGVLALHKLPKLGNVRQFPRRADEIFAFLSRYRGCRRQIKVGLSAALPPSVVALEGEQRLADVAPPLLGEMDDGVALDAKALPAGRAEDDGVGYTVVAALCLGVVGAAGMHLDLGRPAVFHTEERAPSVLSPGSPHVDHLVAVLAVALLAVVAMHRRDILLAVAAPHPLVTNRQLLPLMACPRHVEMQDGVAVEAKPGLTLPAVEEGLGPAIIAVRESPATAATRAPVLVMHDQNRLKHVLPSGSPPMQAIRTLYTKIFLTIHTMQQCILITTMQAQGKALDDQRH